MPGGARRRPNRIGGRCAATKAFSLFPENTINTIIT